jgi:hypothetical protein
MDVECSMHEKNWFKFPIGTPERIKRHGKSKCNWEDNIITGLNDIHCGVWTRIIWLRNVIGSIGKLS